MQFEFVHEFDIPLDALELAVISPNLHQALANRLPNIASVEQKEHALEGTRLERLWSYQANVAVPAFAKKHVTPDMMAWDERSIYELPRHAAEWTIRPHIKPEWQKYFSAKGTYVLSDLGSGRSRRTVTGTIALHVPLVQKMAEKLIVAEVRKTFDAEAETIRDLATLV